jgi:PII-like signaling protein
MRQILERRSKPMKFLEEDVLLRIFMSETARLNGKLLYEEIIMKAREMKLAGATVIRGVMGFGADSHLHSAKLVDLGSNLPIIIEIVDQEDKIEKILFYLGEILKDGFVTLEKVRAIKYREKK